MKRKVILEGEIGERFGREFTINAKSFKDVVQCLNGNFSDFQKYLLEAEERKIGFTCEVGGKPLSDEKELFLQYPEGTMVISALPAGSKSGGAKILAAILVIAVIAASGGFGGAGWFGQGAAVGGAPAAATAGLNTAGMIGVGFALNLAMTGFQQIMAPDPSVDDGTQEENYLFQGTGQEAVEGDPVPMLYGRLRIPARPISTEIKNSRQRFINVGTTTVPATPEAQVEVPASVPNIPAPVTPSLATGQLIKYDLNIYNLTF